MRKWSTGIRATVIFHFFFVFVFFVLVFFLFLFFSIFFFISTKVQKLTKRAIYLDFYIFPTAVHTFVRHMSVIKDLRLCALTALSGAVCVLLATFFSLFFRIFLFLFGFSFAPAFAGHFSCLNHKPSFTGTGTGTMPLLWLSTHNFRLRVWGNERIWRIFSSM